MPSKSKARKIHVVFKTHLDIGFTDDSAAIIDGYMNGYLPAAIKLARDLKAKDDGCHFVWTVGSWLVYEALERFKGARLKDLEKAIADGDVRWHALPFTTHTEYLDASLVRYGLSLSKALDARFGRKTIAAKMTDVPGHTAALVPLLAEAGVAFLHIGVNPASAVPEVPKLCRWRFDGSEVLLCYEGSYGGVTDVPEAGCALAFGFTGDNHGPQSEAELRESFKRLKKENPGGKLVVSSLDAFAEELLPHAKKFPALDAEIGDSWIHGVGTDPEKTRRFKALLRWREEALESHPSFAGREDFRRFSRLLLQVGEHTWGRDTKSNAHFTELSFSSEWPKERLLANRALGVYDGLERTWAEQRRYVDSALDALKGSTLYKDAVAAAAWPSEPELSWRPSSDLRIKGGALELKANPKTGAVELLREGSKGKPLASPENPLAFLRYQVYGHEEYESFMAAYNPNFQRTEWWARRDFSKLGIGEVLRSGKSWSPRLLKAWRDRSGSALKLSLAFPKEAVEGFGAPASAQLVFKLSGRSLDIDLRWSGKDACRVAEALWLRFNPPLASADGLKLVKLGKAVDPRKVVKNGNRALHACERVEWRGQGPKWSIDLLDSALVAPGGGKLLEFDNSQPDPRKGVDLNLWNNIWGTNFPMWYDEDAVFRFRLALLD